MLKLAQMCIANLIRPRQPQRSRFCFVKIPCRKNRTGEVPVWREVTSERIRDKIAASKRKGLWVGGTLPIGYEMKEDKIAVIEEEAELVRLIFRRYLELGSVNELVRDLKERNIRTRAKQVATVARGAGI